MLLLLETGFAVQEDCVHPINTPCCKTVFLLQLVVYSNT